MYWGAIEIPWNYAIHRIPIFLLPASIYSVKPAQPDQAYPQDSINRDRAEGGAGGALAPPLFCKNKNELHKK